MSTQCPYGESLQRYWDIRHELFHRFDDGIQIDAEGLHTVLPETTMQSIAKNIKGQRIIDAFSGVGGASIAFAQQHKNVTSIELNQDRHTIAKHNATVYGVGSHIQYICDDIFNCLRTLNADAIYLDPPWGWPSQNQMTSFTFAHIPINIKKLLTMALNQFNEVVLHLPVIFDNKALAPFQHPYQSIENRFHQRTISKCIYFKGKR